MNDSAWLPGPYDQSLPDKPEEEEYILNNYTIGSENTPICIGYGAAAAKSLRLGLTLCDPIDGSPPGSSVPGILQARIPEWVAISFSKACMHAK